MQVFIISKQVKLPPSPTNGKHLKRQAVFLTKAATTFINSHDLKVVAIKRRYRL